MFSSLKKSLFSGVFKTNELFTRNFTLSSFLKKSDDRRVLISSTPKRDEGTEGEKLLSMDSYSMLRKDMFPTEDLPNRLFNNIPFSEIPICNIRVSKNNTILTISDAKSGHIKMIRSCGIEGFKNTRKGTNIAAQATAITFGTVSKAYCYDGLYMVFCYSAAQVNSSEAVREYSRRFPHLTVPDRNAIKSGYRRETGSFIAGRPLARDSERILAEFDQEPSLSAHCAAARLQLHKLTIQRENAVNKGFSSIRVRVQGLGPGRLSAIKGLEMAGLNIISITDSTRVSWNPPRPRKRRKL